MTRVLVAMSGGVDSSIAAARLVQAGHDVTGVTMKLWGGEGDRGCCSVSDVDDARRAAQQIGVDHHVFNFGREFDEHVVAPYVADHAAGRTPNPCIECNRHLKFDRLLTRAHALGFDLVATGHHARVVSTTAGLRVARGADRAKDQSYVVHVLQPAQLARLAFPVGDLTKAAVRDEARRLGLRTAAKPDSQDVCFITSTGGRAAFLRDRAALHPGTVVDTDGRAVGAVDAVELVTIGQRRGLGVDGTGRPRYAIDLDVEKRVVTVGGRHELLCTEVAVDELRWAGEPVDGLLYAQCSAHGAPVVAQVRGETVQFAEPRPRVAPGQSVVLYDGDVVVGAGIAR